jgi:malate dehydrogenase (oxaloacetate-decarboxylating)
MQAQISKAAMLENGKVKTGLTGYNLLNDPRLNKGTAFTEEERDVFALHGLLPPHIGTLEDQIARREKALQNQGTPFAKYAFMRDLLSIISLIFSRSDASLTSFSTNRCSGARIRQVAP